MIKPRTQGTVTEAILEVASWIWRHLPGITRTQGPQLGEKSRFEVGEERQKAYGSRGRELLLV